VNIAGNWELCRERNGKLVRHVKNEDHYWE
jgi:hypothetical protein